MHFCTQYSASLNFNKDGKIPKFQIFVHLSRNLKLYLIIIIKISKFCANENKLKNEWNKNTPYLKCDVIEVVAWIDSWLQLHCLQIIWDAYQ